MTAKTIRVEVTAEDIAAHNNCHLGNCCPQYAAVSRALGRSDVWVERQNILVGLRGEGGDVLPLPPRAVAWLERFDSNVLSLDKTTPEMKPITFRLRVPA